MHRPVTRFFRSAASETPGLHCRSLFRISGSSFSSSFFIPSRTASCTSTAQLTHHAKWMALHVTIIMPWPVLGAVSTSVHSTAQRQLIDEETACSVRAGEQRSAVVLVGRTVHQLVEPRAGRRLGHKVTGFVLCADVWCCDCVEHPPGRLAQPGVGNLELQIVKAVAILECVGHRIVQLNTGLHPLASLEL